MNNSQLEELSKLALADYFLIDPDFNTKFSLLEEIDSSDKREIETIAKKVAKKYFDSKFKQMFKDELNSKSSKIVIDDLTKKFITRLLSVLYSKRASILSDI